MIRWGGQHPAQRACWGRDSSVAAEAYSSSAAVNEEEGAGSSRRTRQRLARA